MSRKSKNLGGSLGRALYSFAHVVGILGAEICMAVGDKLEGKQDDDRV